MSQAQAYVIEVADQQVGIVVREPGERVFQFHSAISAVHELDGRPFATPQAAERAAVIHLAQRRDQKLAQLAKKQPAARPQV
jgi:hypothetical protein